MAWNFKSPMPVSKAGASAAIAALSASSCFFADTLGASDPKFAGQLAAAKTAAIDAVAGLTGNAPNIEVTMMGKSDTNTSASLPGAAGGQITITVMERWS